MHAEGSRNLTLIDSSRLRNSTELHDQRGCNSRAPIMWEFDERVRTVVCERFTLVLSFANICVSK